MVWVDMFVRVCSIFFILLILCFDRSLRQLIFYGLNTGSVEISTLAESIKLQKYGDITSYLVCRNNYWMEMSTHAL